MQTCRVCKEEKPQEQFPFEKRRNRYDTRCRACANESVKRWKKSNPDRERRIRRNSELKRKYGITYDEMNAMWEAQDNRCLCCGVEMRRGQGGGSVDHCHKSGKVRGILCRQCNQILGQANEDIEHLRKIITFIEEYC